MKHLKASLIVPEATAVPLTKSSTHLVSITLDLIVIVEQLFEALRREAVILELVTLRLAWDRIRLQLINGIKNLAKDIRNLRSNLTAEFPTFLQGSPTNSSKAASFEGTPIPQRLAYLETTIRYLGDACQHECGGLVDRMIDLAGLIPAIQDNDDARWNSAPAVRMSVPDTMLDIQEDLELQVNDLVSQIELLRKQWQTALRCVTSRNG